VPHAKGSRYEAISRLDRMDTLAKPDPLTNKKPGGGVPPEGDLDRRWQCISKNMWGTIARDVPPSRAMRGQRFSCTGSRVFAMRITQMICLCYWTLLTRPTQKNSSRLCTR
jgi:hypothetical protein